YWMNPQLLTELAQWTPFGVILFAIISGIVFQQRSIAYLERRIGQVDKRIDDSNRRIDDLRADMNQRFASLEKVMESQFSRIYDRLDRLEGRIEHPVVRP